MTATLTTQTEITADQVNEIVNNILTVLGEPNTEVRLQAWDAFHRGDHQLVKILAATNLSDNYCKCLGYLGGALKLLPTTATILAEASRAAAESVKDEALRELSAVISEVLNS